MILKRQRAWRLGFVASSVYELSSWLMENLNLYLYDPAAAGPLSADIHRWHGRLQRRAGAGPALIPKPIPCPACRKMGLQQEHGSDVVKCRECGLIQPAEVYEDSAADAAEAADSATEGKPAPPAPRRRKPKGTAA